MSYIVKIIRAAEKDLDAIRGRDFDAIKTKILSLSRNPRPFGSKKMTHEEGYRMRQGDFRILYRVDDRAGEVMIYRIKRRGSAYR